MINELLEQKFRHMKNGRQIFELPAWTLEK